MSNATCCRKLGLSGCMRIEGPGLGLHGLAGGMAVQEGRLRVLGLRGLNVASRGAHRAGLGSQLAGSALGELLAALAAARYDCSCAESTTCDSQLGIE